jgi:nucleoside-diphosphate-sugar epimerase
MAHPSSGRRVLVTGLDGFTGFHAAAALQAAGFEIVDAAAGGSFDLSDRDSVRAALDGLSYDHVLHLAAISFVGHADAAGFYAVNTVGTTNLLEAVAASGNPIRKVVVASSANVYGNSDRTPIDEDTPPAPVNHYACSKLAMEHLVRQWHGRLPTLVARPFNYTGRGQAESFLIPKIVKHFAERRPVLELGNLDVTRDFSDVRDVAAIYARLLDCDASGQIVNICSGRGWSLRGIIDTCADIAGFMPEIRVNPAFVRPDEIKVLIGSNARLRALTGAEPSIDLAETLAWMLARG